MDSGIWELKDQIPEERIFDKADEAEKIELMKQKRDEIIARVKELEAQVKKADAESKPKLEKRVEKLQNSSQSLSNKIETQQDKKKK